MFGDLGKIMKLAGQMKEKMPELKQKLAESEYTAAAGGGAVEATVNGRMQLMDLKLSEELRADGEVSLEMLEDLIKAAISAAQNKAAEAAREAMNELTGGMELPGMDGLL